MSSPARQPEKPIRPSECRERNSLEADEIFVAGFVFSKNEKVLVAPAEFAVVVGLGEVEFAAEDGLDVLLLHGVEEVDGSVDVAMVGHGGSGLADLAEVGGELVYVAGTVEKGVIGVKMKVGELCCHIYDVKPPSGEENAGLIQPVSTRVLAHEAAGEVEVEIDSFE